MKEKPSLLIIGNSNVGKSSIAKLLIPNPKLYKGKVGKSPGSTRLIRSLDLENMPYKIVDGPGFGYMKSASKRREEHVKQQIVIHVEKHHQEYFLGLVVLNALRIEDELDKYFIKNRKTIPLSFELIQFLREFSMPILLIINKIDKVSIFDKKRIMSLLIDAGTKYGLSFITLDDYQKHEKGIPYLEFSALKKTNLEDLKKCINLTLDSR